MHGAFDAGDAVAIVGPEGVEVAQGLSTMSARDLRRVTGLRSDEVRDARARSSRTRSCTGTAWCWSGEEAASERRADRAPRRSARPACSPACPRARKDDALCAVADALERRAAEILAENDEDVRLARENGLADALVDRLLLDEDRLRDVGRERARRRRAARPRRRGRRRLAPAPTASRSRKVRVPLGVVAVIYEARPNVTVDAAALCLKTGNAVILRGGSAAMHSNRILAEVVHGRRHRGRAARARRSRALAAGPRGARRADEQQRLRRPRHPARRRGAQGRTCWRTARCRSSTPPAATATSTSTRAADLEKALPIIVNAKCQRPGVCNAAETLLVHADVAAEFLPRAAKELKRRGVELVVDKAAVASTYTWQLPPAA